MREDNTNAHNEHKEEMPTDTGGEDGLDYDVEGLFDVQNGIKKSETEKRPVGPMMITATALWKSMEQNNKIKSCLQHREILRRLSSNLEYMEYTFVTLDPDRHPIGRFMNNLEDDRREMEKAFKDIEEADGKLPNVDELTADAKLLANGTVLSSPMRFYKKRALPSSAPLNSLPPLIVAWSPKGAKDIYDEAESVWVPLYVDKRRERAIATVQIPCGRSQRDKWILASVAVFLNSPA
ncbi:hypothetical protein QR680_012293 [Steinernema hermaphroditum]|uniref:Dynein heavy chain C-terminal domain-containing protein n=1 Tax=Steinernema hermaphroditum TaxID=289476 RepID=A0AA39M098_9BILA|nr:hypothetical protein QR680_012293 [Steinernema hermaphroditum]